MTAAAAITKRLSLLAVFALALTFIAPSSSSTLAASKEAEIGAAIESAFQQLRSGNYDALYEVLPSASQSRIPRERFTGALQNTRGMYELDKLEIGKIHVDGEMAVADTIVYGRMRQPFSNEGKIVVRQYLVYEQGRWRIMTGDRASIRQLASRNPEFARKYGSASAPSVYVKRDGRWVKINANGDWRRMVG